jgi:hypothetical protein
MDGRKPRADAKLRNLPPDQRTKLTEWLVDDGLSYAEAKERLLEDFGIKTSIGAIGNFFALECQELRFRAARRVADRIGEMLEEAPNALDKATIAAAKQRAFDMAVAKEGSVKDLTMIMSTIADAQRLAIEQAKLALAQEKSAQDERRLSVEEQRLEILKVKAAEAVLAKSSEIVAIASDAGLSSQQKVDAARRVLFGDAHVDGKEVQA